MPEFARAEVDGQTEGDLWVWHLGELVRLPAAAGFLAATGAQTVPAFRVLADSDLPSHGATEHDNRTRSEWLGIGAMEPRTGQAPANPKKTPGSNTRYLIQPLEDAATGVMAGNLIVPEDYASGGTLKVYWTNDGAGSGNVVLYVVASARGDGDDLNSTTGEVGGTQSAVAAPAQGILKITTTSAVLSSLTAGQVVNILCGRLGSDGSDTLTNAIGILGVKFEYTADM